MHGISHPRLNTMLGDLFRQRFFAWHADFLRFKLALGWSDVWRHEFTQGKVQLLWLHRLVQQRDAAGHGLAQPVGGRVTGDE